MQIDSNVAATNQLSVNSNAGSVSNVSGESSQVSGQPEGAQQQSDPSQGSIISLLKQDGVLVNFSIDKETNEFVVKVINPLTNEVIRQIPPEEFTSLVSSMQQTGGVLVDKQA